MQQNQEPQKQKPAMKVKFSHVDDWGRALFKQVDGNRWFYPENLPDTMEDINSIQANELKYYGTDPECDPMGTIIKDGALEIER